MRSPNRMSHVTAHSIFPQFSITRRSPDGDAPQRSFADTLTADCGLCHSRAERVQFLTDVVRCQGSIVANS
eukprot:1191150-Prorocentrum_minimum.AAC.6